MRFLQLPLCVAACLIAGTIYAQAASPQLGEVAELFAEHNVVGTLVVASADQQSVYVHNPLRSTERFAPASTFKIPNTLIALDAGIVTSKDSTFAWDGTDRGVLNWNRDQTLASAFKFSCVWCYQEIARKAGTRRYRDMLARMAYGNQSAGGAVDMFWLNGELTISAVEQIEFLRKLVRRDLPFRDEHFDTLRDIMLVEKKDNHAVYAKSGWSGSGTKPQVGWYVGYVETGSGTWLFALNMRIDDDAQVSLRIELAMNSLAALDII